MNRRRFLLGTAGALLVSAVLLAGGAVASVLPVGSALSVLGNDYFLVAGLGVLSLSGAAVAVERGGVDQSEMPDPERAVAVPTPGDRLCETLDRRRLAVPFVGTERRRAVESRLRESAVAAVRRAENCTLEEARERVAAGTWTDDDDAAAFLASNRGPPPGAYVRAALNRETWFAHGARRTADEIASRTPPGRAEPMAGGGTTA